MVWNLQNFGDAVPAKGNYVPLCNFIAYVVNNQRADVFVLQELRQAGIAYLDQLNRALDAATGGDWYYDHVLGALAVDPNATLPTTAANTAMDMDHHEGYAVFWNNARSAAFTVVAPPEAISQGTAPVDAGLPGGVPANAATLVYRGRDQSAGIGHNGWFNAANFTPDAPNANSFLNFCQSAARIHVGDVRAIGPRRPCAFTLNLDPANAHNTPARYLLPVIVYHATSNAMNTRINVQLSGYSRQLYQVYNPTAAAWANVENAIIGGDFNINAQVNNTNRDAYLVYVNGYGQGGANAGPSFVTADNFGTSPSTTVQIRNLHTRALITGTTPAAFRSLAIDHIFYRMPNNQPATNFNGSVVDLFDLVMNSNNYGGLPAIIHSFWTPIATALGAWLGGDAYANFRYRNDDSDTPARNDDGTGMVIGDLANWAYFVGGMTESRYHEVNGMDTDDDARAAAEFINKLVSDHLPTIFRFDY